MHLCGDGCGRAMALGNFQCWGVLLICKIVRQVILWSLFWIFLLSIRTLSSPRDDSMKAEILSQRAVKPKTID